MPNYEKLTENLTRRGYTVRRFAAAQQAADYLDSVIDQTSGWTGCRRRCISAL